MNTVGQPIECRAAVAWEAGAPAVRTATAWFLKQFSSLSGEERASLTRFIIPEVMDLRRNLPPRGRLLLDNMAAMNFMDVQVSDLAPMYNDFVRVVNESGFPGVASKAAWGMPAFHVLRFLQMDVRDLRQAAKLLRDMATIPGHGSEQSLFKLAAMFEKTDEKKAFVPSRLLLDELQIDDVEKWVPFVADGIGAAWDILGNLTESGASGVGSRVFHDVGVALHDISQLLAKTNAPRVLKPVSSFLESVALNLDRGELDADHLNNRLSQLVNELPLLTVTQGQNVAKTARIVAEFFCNMRTVAEVSPICAGVAAKGGPMTRWGGPRSSVNDTSLA